MKTFWTIALIILLGTIFVPGMTYAQNPDRAADNETRRQQEALQQNAVAQQQPAAGQPSLNLNYNVLVPLPGVPQSINSDTNVSEYLVRIVQVILGFCVALATFMVLFGGVRMATTDAFTTRSEGKKTIQEALKGLAIALGAFLILNTISPDLVNFKLELPGVDIPAPPQTSVSEPRNTNPDLVETVPGKITNPSIVAPCSNCVSVNPGELPIKGPFGNGAACQGQSGNTSGCQMDADLKNKMLTFHSNVQKNQLLNGTWQINEAWPPTVLHNSIQQRSGESIDIGYKESSKPNYQKPEYSYEMILEGRNAGLKVVYETSDTSQLNEIKNALKEEFKRQGMNDQEATSVAQSHVLPRSGNPHYSVYKLR